MKKTPQHIIISRTDSIGDVVLTLPMAGVLKKHFPEIKITFLVASYTLPVVQCSEFVDDIIDWTALCAKPESDRISSLKKLKADYFIHVFPTKEIAGLTKKAGIKYRIGTIRRWFNLTTCNVFVNYTRRNSDMHEAQLNLKMLAPLGIDQPMALAEFPAYYGLVGNTGYSKEINSLLAPDKFNLILHPKSKGSAVDWHLENYQRVIELLPAGKFEVFITGTEAEGKLIGTTLHGGKHVHNLTGKMTLQAFIGFINKADGLLACSTGPLHIAAALGINAIGLFSPRKPIHPGRWRPVGKKAKVFCKDSNLPDAMINDAELINSILPDEVVDYLLTLIH